MPTNKHLKQTKVKSNAIIRIMEKIRSFVRFFFVIHPPYPSCVKRERKIKCHIINNTENKTLVMWTLKQNERERIKAALSQVMIALERDTVHYGTGSM